MRVATGERKPLSLQGRVRQRQRENDKTRPSVIARNTCSIGDIIACFPSAYAVELVEKQIARQREPHVIEEPDITFIDEEELPND